MTRAAILNVTGYAGAELARILHRHPDVDLVSVTGRSAAGKDLAEVFPHLRDIELTIAPDVDEPVDVVFSALPHAASAERVGPFLERGVAVVDISADFRLKDRDIYESWYQVDHPYPQYIEEAVYGLPELHRPDIARTKLTANPGCFPTGAILGMAPSVSEGVVEPDVVYDAKTGVSGAGRSGNVKYNFSELNDNTQAYSVSGHRHQPEMTQELSALSSDGDVSVTFTPHLVPMTRGILGTCYARLERRPGPGTNRRDIQGLLRRRTVRNRRVGIAVDQADVGQQPMPRAPGREQTDRAFDRGHRPRQPCEGRGRQRRPKHERDAGDGRNRWPRGAADIPLRAPSGAMLGAVPCSCHG